MAEQAIGFDEQETTWTIEATDRNRVRVFSNDPIWQRRLESVGIVPDLVDGYGRFYAFSLDEYQFNVKRKPTMTDEQKQARLQRLKPSGLPVAGQRNGLERAAV